ncbi:sugar 3,4-ketoisomerase [Cedecea sp. NFIX57]|uniref:sugar 3,4-ketoisomerase n=1 Tax=Cedecea sp. NFIX57 TaxID=1566286 RepID=UPI000A0DE0FE|nr:FdtA/QdtA family cupin domain-containing protein [Cedecea sp. NFIX57]SMG26075.1 dTDP-4-dehydrorhamnose 3,5-epimerase [Cedecea sp. NFIX57]
MKIEFIPLQMHGDERGSLIALEESANIPFEIKRVYYMFDTCKNVTRGYHAHKALKQVAIVIRGSCCFVLDDGKDRVEVILDNPAQGLLINSVVWREMKDFTPDCILMVLASEHYDENDYIRNYNDFLRYVHNECE